MELCDVLSDACSCHCHLCGVQSYVPLLSGNQRYVLASTGLDDNPEEGDVVRWPSLR